MFGRLVAVDSPESVDGPLPGDGADAVYLYDERDDLVQVELTDPADTTRVQLRYFEYDALGNLRFATNPENGTVSYLSYDAGGRLLHHRDTASREFINTYDEAGRLVLQQGKICPMPSCPSNPALTLLANTYDVGNAGFDSGAAAGKLTQQKSYRDDSGQSALVSTRDYRYGTGDGACPMVGMPTGVHLGLKVASNRRRRGSNPGTELSRRDTATMRGVCRLRSCTRTRRTPIARRRRSHGATPTANWSRSATRPV